MKKIKYFGAILIGLVAGCGGGETTGETQTSAGSETATAAPTEAAPTEAVSPSVVARYEGMLAEALPMVIELDDANGGTVTFPDSGRTQTIHDCVGNGGTLTCQLAIGDMAGEIEITRREGGIDGRSRQESDNTWADFTADAVAE